MSLFDFYKEVLETYDVLFPDGQHVDKCEVIDLAEKELKDIDEDKQISKELYYSTLQSLFSYSMSEEFFESKNNELNYFIKTINDFLEALELPGKLYKVDFQRTYNSNAGVKSWKNKNVFLFSNLKKKDLEGIFSSLDDDFVVSFSPDLPHNGVEVVLKEKKKLPIFSPPKITKEDFLEKAAECGHRSFTIMAGALDGVDIKPTYLSHEDVTGVGYGICTFYPENENKERCFLTKYLEAKENNKSNDEYVKLAIKSLTSYITNKEHLSLPNNLPKEMLEKKAGVFVSIHKFGNLRGCIGTFLPTTDSIAEEIIDNAIKVSTEDPRFSPITKDEIPYLEVNVDVLSEPVPTTKEELDPKKYGVIVRQGYKRGLLLPDLEGVDTVDYQISIAKQKAGITSGDIELERFEVIRHK